MTESEAVSLESRLEQARAGHDAMEGVALLVEALDIAERPREHYTPPPALVRFIQKSREWLLEEPE